LFLEAANLTASLNARAIRSIMTSGE